VFSYALVNEQGEICWYPIITGAANTNDFAYAEEGARTAAIGAALKSLCFQLPVYKGQLDHHNAGKLLGSGTQPGGNGNGNGAKPSGNSSGRKCLGAARRSLLIWKVGYAPAAWALRPLNWAGRRA
jgi:hypothetical protein